MAVCVFTWFFVLLLGLLIIIIPKYAPVSA